MVSKLAANRNVVRHVGGSQVSVDQKTGDFDIDASAFDRTLKDADGLSFIQRLILSKNSRKDEDEIRRVFVSRRSPGKTSQFVELNVGQALEALSLFDIDFYFCEDPLDEEGEKLANPAHAVLIGLPFKGEPIGSMRSELAGELLSGVVTRIFPAVL